MSLNSFEARRYAGPGRSGAPKIRTLKYSIGARQKSYRRNSASLHPDAVDPALLYAKLEVVRMELESARRDNRDQMPAPREKQSGLPARGSLQAEKAFSRRQRELMRRSMPVGAELMADGKPVFNTAQILAALEHDDKGHTLAQTLIQRHDSGMRSKRSSHEPVMADSKRPSQDSDREEDAHLSRSKQGSNSRRRFKIDDSAPTKLVATKHGSQTTYERVELPVSGLLEDADSDNDHSDARPKLSKYDRPHWAQQSQDPHEMSLLKQAVQTAKRKAPRPLSQIPGWEEQDAAMEGSGRAAQASRNDSTISDTLIADAVSQIKKEERLRKWHSVQNFLKRPPYLPELQPKHMKVIPKKFMATAPAHSHQSMRATSICRTAVREAVTSSSRRCRAPPTCCRNAASVATASLARQWPPARTLSHCKTYATAAAVAHSIGPDPSTVTQQAIIEGLDPKEKARLDRVRNIGIAAHIDSGKTTATERVLFYTGRIKSIHEVRGKDAVGAKMDSMDLEREKGITIQSAATFCDWMKKEEDAKTGEIADQRYHINLIDTPGHIDFTIEVERALRVLDGAVMILCAVSGVQSQTVTVDRQMKRYNVPRISFVNKMDRAGANPWKAVDGINQKLKIAAAAVQIPIGAEDEFKGVVDLIGMKAIYSEGENGETVRVDEVPADLKEFAEEKRQVLIETLADVDDDIANVFLDERTPSPEEIKAAIRRATISLKFTPVMMGSALADKSVQPMLDAVCDYLPNPAEVENLALDQKRAEAPVKLISYNSLPFVGLAFKLEESNFGQLTYIRVYQGTLRKGLNVYNARTGQKVKVPRIVRMHSNEMEEVQEIGAGEICAVFGIDCASGDTFTDGSLGYSMTSMFVPEAVISLSIKPKQNKDSANFSKAMSRFQREDPTFRVHNDAESGETIISGMGELHLSIYVERMKREYGVLTETGQPQVAYRETVQGKLDFDHTLKKQTGGSGDFARIVGYLEPTGELTENNFDQSVVGGNIDEKYLLSCEKGFHQACVQGPLLGHRVLGVHMHISDGATHMTDSSEFAFANATQQAFRKAFKAAQPLVLEPLMKTVITAPTEFQGNIVGLLNKRNAIIHDTEVGSDDFVLTADCSLNSMFGFSSQLRAATQGKGEFTMEFSHYAPAPMQLQKELIAKAEKERLEKQKK